MAKLNLILYIKSKRISTSSVDLDSVGHNCANPLRTGALDRMGSESVFQDPEQALLIDAAVRACDKMDWTLEVVDVAKYGLIKRIRSNEEVPRLEANGKPMYGVPTSREIIEFYSEEKSHKEVSMNLQEQKRIEAF